jgi:glucose-1-phosphate adenylyltransferase
MQTPALPPGTTQRTLAIIMGGGAGTRLFPLTKDRAKPAVPLGGKYRLVDIPISNCLNSGLRSIYLLTQFNTMSLHRHIQASYKFDNFSRSFVDILAAQQTPEGSQWYQGTADPRDQTCETRPGLGVRNHAQRRRPADHPIRRETEGGESS